MDQADGDARTANGPEEIRVVDLPERATAVVRGRVPIAELRAFFDRAFQDLARSMAEGGFTADGPAMSLYRGVPVETADVEVGFPVRGRVRPSEPVVEGSLPSVRAVTTVHRGNYDALGESWARLAEWARREELVLGELLWEVYVTEPTPGADPGDMVAKLYWALRS